tara:strand:- start:28456 stop:28872 length:417 start_codon:yes stop_codon:yes gene_type:complete
MRLFIFCNENRPAIPGSKGDVKTLSSTDISSAIDYYYSRVEAFGFVESSESEDCIQQLLSKVGAGGVVKLQGVDIYQAAEALCTGDLNISDFSTLVLKGKNRPTSLHSLMDEVKSSGEFSIEYAGISGLHYILEARRK